MPIRPGKVSAKEEAAVRPEDAFAEVMARLRAGDPDAARYVFDRFARRLAGLASLRLGARLRAKVDPEDVVQAAYKSFFIRHAKGQFELNDWDDLWVLLTVITARKCGLWLDHFHAARRDVDREASPPPGDRRSSGWEALAREPTPDEVVTAADTAEHLLGEFHGRDRAVVALALQGCGAGEIADQVGCSERTAYRVLERARGRLRQLRGEGTGVG
jgi:RNA polymerase sigma-70 factor (ECF subfamily)